MANLKDLHWAIDFYGISTEAADDDDKIYQLLAWANRELFKSRGIIQMTPVHNTKKPQNNGISGIINAPFGHFTIHTFSQRKVAFVDLFEELDNETLRRNRRKMLISAMKQYLPYLRCDLRQEHCPRQGFGDHVLLECGYNSLAHAIKVTQQIVSEIEMTPLAAQMITLQGENYDLIQPISESHIAFHAQPDTDRTLIDVFSCKPFACDKLNNVLEVWGLKPRVTIKISRGIQLEDKTL